MYLHLGQNTVVPEDTVIGIFDIDNSSWSYITRNYLNEAEKNKKLINISDDIPKSFVLCGGKTYNTESIVYLSQLSSQTLLKRSETSMQSITTGKDN